jgi:hypothetical protein
VLNRKEQNLLGFKLHIYIEKKIDALKGNLGNGFSDIGD